MQLVWYLSGLIAEVFTEVWYNCTVSASVVQCKKVNGRKHTDFLYLILFLIQCAILKQLDYIRWEAGSTDI